MLPKMVLSIEIFVSIKLTNLQHFSLIIRNKTYLKRDASCYLARYLPLEHKFLRILPTFAVSFGKKIRTHASFTKILANCISEETLITAVYDKNII